MKKLTIRHFGPIEEASIELKRVNLILGPQSSGKSTVLKVACFCDWMERQMVLTQNPEKYCQASFFVRNLVQFHKLDGFMHSDTYIRYDNDSISFEYDASENRCRYQWAKTASKRWNYRRVKIAYIPSERNLVATIPNWYQVSMNDNNILDFMKEWEFARKKFSKKLQILDMPFNYRYDAKEKGDRIVIPNGGELELTNASSGLQSMTPLFVMLRYLTNEYFKEKHSTVEESILRDNMRDIVAHVFADKTQEAQMSIVDGLLTSHHADLYIEEPEAHIFPTTQKEFVYSLVNMLNGQKKHMCFIATHSPYLMTAFNNLIQAGELIAVSKQMAEKVTVRFAKRQTLRYKDVAAFAMKEGRVVPIMDDEYKLISADALDEASQKIADDFNFLLSL